MSAAKIYAINAITVILICVANVSGYTINMPLMRTAKKNTNASRRRRVNIQAPTSKIMLIHFTSMIVLPTDAIGIFAVDIQRNVTIPNPITATLASRFDAILRLANPRSANTDTPVKNSIPIPIDPPDQNATSPRRNDMIQKQRSEIIVIKL